MSWLHQKKGNYRLNSKQGQRGIQEAQTCTKREYHIADQDYFHVGEKSKEWVLRGVCFWGGGERQLTFTIREKKISLYQNDRKWTNNRLKSPTATDGWQDVDVERDHNQQETSKKHKRDFISKWLVEPPSDRWPQNKTKSCENLQTTLKRENHRAFKYAVT